MAKRLEANIELDSVQKSLANKIKPDKHVIIVLIDNIKNTTQMKRNR